MSEKRFYLGNNDTTICDRSQGGSDGFNMLTIFKVVDLLNKQQATIDELQSIINHIKCEENCEDYDYCCETVCSLYKEIKYLKEENEQLREINKELGDDLYNCRLNKNIISEKLKLWQDDYIRNMAFTPSRTLKSHLNLMPKSIRKKGYDESRRNR